MNWRTRKAAFSGIDRRALIERALAGLGGLATWQFPSAALAPAAAAKLGPSEPGAGPLVTGNPIKEPIQKSGVAVELVDFARAPESSGGAAYARLNFLYHAGDGSGRLFTCDSRGFLYELDPNTGATQLMLDVRSVRGGLWFGANFFMGLRSFAFHPDFARPGRPGYQKLYTVNTERAAGVARFGGPYVAHHHDVVAEWSIDPANPARVNPSSRREVLRVAQWGEEHNTDQLMFDPHLEPGAPGYGAMLIGVGDGGNSPLHTDPFDQVQDPANAHGKILRIDPLLQSTGAPYGIPADNPFIGRAGFLPEIWAMGLRHPQNISFDSGASGKLFIADIGQHQVEEINLGYPGHNYGWPLREGAFTTDRGRVGDLYALPADHATRGFTDPVAQYDHGAGVAVTGGFVYRGAAVPELVGHYLFGDIKIGRIFHVPADELVLGQQATIKELTLVRGGQETTLRGLLQSSNGRVDLRFGQDQAGEVFITTKQDGWIRKIRPAACGLNQCGIDGLRYIATYGDLIRAFGADAAAGQRHYAETGRSEGRIPDGFSPVRYLAKYPDLQAAFGSDTQAAIVHYIRSGYYEGRTDRPM
jgi:glucose/arabinose dehydrogenase